MWLMAEGREEGVYTGFGVEKFQTTLWMTVNMLYIEKVVYTAYHDTYSEPVARTLCTYVHKLI